MTLTIVPQAFTLEIEMLADWHVGTGAGQPGGIDRLLARDENDLPFLPAKTVTGIWRDACEQAAAALDAGSGSLIWTHWLERLFGNEPARSQNHDTAPMPAALSIRPARLSPALRAALGGDIRLPLRQALTFVKPGVAIDGATGQAMDDHLRFVEMGRKGMRLYADCALDGEGPTPSAAQALLLAGAGLVERIGGKRRRGSGQCRLRLGQRDAHGVFAGFGADALETAWSWLDSATANTIEDPRIREPEAVTPSVGSAAGAADQASAAQHVDWVELDLTLTLRTPVLIPDHTLGNAVTSLDFIPGTYLLGHVLRRLWNLGQQDLGAAAQNGDLQVLPAYLDIAGERGLPAPLAWTRPKMARLDAGQPALVNRLADSPPQGMQYQGLKDGYITIAPSDQPKVVRRSRPQLTARAHNTIKDELQRPTEDVGGLYSYEAIAAGTVLRSCIRMRKYLADDLTTADNAWWKGLAGPCRLGKSKKDDYGAVDITPGDALKAVDHPAFSEGSSTATTLDVWLLSDTLVRGETLRPDPTPAGLAKALSDALGQGVTLVPDASFVRTRRVDSWQVSWGLPRPSLVALQAGSCLKFQVSGTIDGTRLADLSEAGIGERRAEGYGQLAIDAPGIASPTAGWLWQEARSASPTTATAPAIGSNATDHGFALLVEREAWRTAIRQASLRVAYDDAACVATFGIKPSDASRKPGHSQLGALRAAMTQASAEGMERFGDWLTALQKVDNRKDKWPPTALAQLRKLVNEREYIWHILKIEVPELTDAGKERQQGSLRPEAIHTLIDAWLRRLIQNPHGASANTEGSNG